MSKTQRPSRAPAWKGFAWLVTALLVAALLAAGAGWLMRERLAQWLVSHWCQERALTCEAQFEQVQFGAIGLSQLRVRNGGEVPLETGPVAIGLEWPGLFRPQVTSLSVDQPVLRVRYDGDMINAHGLAALLPGDSGAPPGKWPQIEIAGGRAEIDTPAGRLVGSFSASASSADNIEAQVHISPARLASPEGEIEWTRGDIELRLRDGSASGEARLQLDRARLGEIAIEDARLEARLAPMHASGVIALDWSGELASAAWRSGQLSGVRTSGSAQVARVEMSGPRALLAAVDKALFSVEAGAAALGDASAQDARLDVDLSATGSGLSGPLAFEARDAHYRGHRAGEVATTSQAVIGADGSGSLDGRLVLKATTAAPSLRDEITRSLATDGVLQAHAQVIGKQLNDALGDFDVGLQVALDVPASGDWAFSGAGPTLLRAANGLTARIEPFGNGRWIETAGSTFELRGDIALRHQASGLDVSGRVGRLQSSPEGLELIAENLVMRRFEANDLAIALDLENLAYTRRDDQLRALASGSVTIDGQLPGARLSATSLFGGIDAVRGVEGWRIQTRGARCLGLDTAGATFQSVRLGQVAIALCPEDGRFLQQRGGHPEGVVSIGNLVLPFSTIRASGDIAMEAARLEWVMDGGLYTRLSASNLAFGLETGGETLQIDARAPTLEASAGPGPLQIAGGLRDIALAGSLIPANVTAASGDFVLNDSAEGPGGRATLETVRISDPRKDPVFEPLLASAEAELKAGIVSIGAPLRLAGTGLLIGRGNLQLAFPAIDGFGSFQTEQLRFRDGLLQPHDLSERLRGYFTNAQGEASASAAFRIRGGEVTGTGQASLRDFGFQTLALSRVRGVNTTVMFDSLFPLSTPPAQVFTVAEIDPGISLNSGEVRFQLVEGREARLEAARWPFAGGELFVEPSIWQVAGGRNMVAVRIESASLGALSEELSVPGLVAEGTVSGRFPVEFSGGNVFIRDARLVADDNGGRLSYTGRIADQASSTDENVALAFRALEDFDFRVLEIGADGDVTGDIVLRARLLGHNDQVLGGAEFDFNVSIDSELAQLLSSSRQWSGTDWLADIEARRADAPLPGTPDGQ